MNAKSIAYTYFSSVEDDILHGMPTLAQLLYLRGLRRYMDYSTAIVGGPARRISLRMFCELIETFPHQGMAGERPDKSKVRRLLGWLVRAGLIEQVPDKDGFLVYFLPHALDDYRVADAHYSDQNKPDTIKHQKQTKEEPNSDAGLSHVFKSEKTAKNRKPDTHLISNIKQIQTTTTTNDREEFFEPPLGGGSEALDDQIVFATKPAPIKPSQPSPSQPEPNNLASWEENLIFPSGLRPSEQAAIVGLLKRCPIEAQQPVLDELTARRAKVSSPVGYIRKLVECAVQGDFIPEAGSAVAEARERRKNDYQTTSNKSKGVQSDSLKAEIARLTGAMVAAQHAGDFKQYSRLGAQVGRLV